MLYIYNNRLFNIHTRSFSKNLGVYEMEMSPENVTVKKVVVLADSDFPIII